MDIKEHQSQADEDCDFGDFTNHAEDVLDHLAWAFFAARTVGVATGFVGVTGSGFTFFFVIFHGIFPYRWLRGRPRITKEKSGIKFCLYRHTLAVIIAPLNSTLNGFIL
jgi:hypothetical protein